MNHRIILFTIISFSHLLCMQEIDYDLARKIALVVRNNDLEEMKQIFPSLDKPTRNHTFVNWIAASKNPEALQFFIDQETDIHATNLTEQTALFNSYKSAEMTQLLLDNGARIDATDMNKQTPLHYFMRSYKIDLNAAIVLIQNNANINALDDKGQTPLHCAAQHAYIDYIQLLLTHNADKSIKTKGGRTALDYVQALDRKQYPNKFDAIVLLNPSISKETLQKAEEFLIQQVKQLRPLQEKQEQRLFQAKQLLQQLQKKQQQAFTTKKTNSNPVIYLIQLLSCVNKEYYNTCNKRKNLTNDILNIIRSLLEQSQVSQ